MSVSGVPGDALSQAARIRAAAENVGSAGGGDLRDAHNGLPTVSQSRRAAAPFTEAARLQVKCLMVAFGCDGGDCAKPDHGEHVNAGARMAQALGLVPYNGPKRTNDWGRRIWPPRPEQAPPA